MNIDTQEVLAAAATKWNFLPFKPGLVGGHCIGVDPYYLAQRAQEFGYHPEIILAGRRLNDSMGEYIASQVVKLMIKKGISVNGANLLMLGITFKENCPDVRNTKIVDVVRALKEYGITVTIYDPLANIEEVKKEYKLKTTNSIPKEKFDAIVLGVAHKEFLKLNFSELQESNSLIYDVKGVLGTIADNRL
jgi:UDP-N-acetyl-D-galactosamine dehydrogenase